jgi:hypothetical protein
MKKLLGVLTFLLISYMSYSQLHSSEFRFGGKIQSSKSILQPTPGISISTSGYKGVWVLLNKDPYFIYEINFDTPRLNVKHYPFLSLSSTEAWNHQRLEDVRRYYSWGVGAGKQLRSFGVHTSVHMNGVNIRYLFIDPTYTLSTSGRYTIRGHQEAFMSLKVGTIFRSKFRCTFKFDVQVVPNWNCTIGAGVRLG